MLCILKKIAAGVRSRIIKTTQSGRDVDGNKFKETTKKKFGAYSYGYGRKRLNNNRVTDRVTLTYHFDMLAMKIVETPGKVEIEFNGSDMNDIAVWHNEGKGNNPKREFFGINNDDDKFIDNYLKTKVKNYG